MKWRNSCWGAVTYSPTTAACFPATPRAGGWATGESGPDACEGGGVANERPFGDLPRVNLRGFQREAIDQIEREVARGVRSVLYAAPTGSAAEITRRAAQRNQRVLVLAHRRASTDQTSRKLTANGVRLGMHGIVLGGRGRDLRPQAMVQVASIDTLLARGVRSKIMPLPPADIIIFDETHRIRGRTRE